MFDSLIFRYEKIFRKIKFVFSKIFKSILKVVYFSVFSKLLKLLSDPVRVKLANNILQDVEFLHKKNENPITNDLENFVQNLHYLNNESLKKPILTIAISTFNRDKWLKYSLPNLLSLIADKNGLVHLLVVDNASQDGTQQLCEQYRENANFSVLRNAQNVGMLGNLKVVAENAIGDYLWIVGDDDIVNKGAIENIIYAIVAYQKPEMIYLNYSISWESIDKFKTLEEYVGNSIPICNISHMQYTSKLRDIALFNENLFTAIFCCVFKREHAINCYSGYSNEDPFMSLESSVPTTKYVLENLLERPGVWVGRPSIVVNPDVSWKKYLFLWFMQVLPLIYDKLKYYGVTDKALRNEKIGRLEGCLKYTVSAAVENPMWLEKFNFIRFKKVYSTIEDARLKTIDNLISKYNSSGENIPQDASKENVHPKNKIAIISTFRQKCGIATYTEKLAAALIKFDKDVIVCSQITDNPQLSAFEKIKHYRLWRNDLNIMLKNFDFGLVDHLIIQYHPAFYTLNSLISFARMLALMSKSFDIILHTTGEFLYDDRSLEVLEIKELGGSLLIHSKNEYSKLCSKYPNNSFVEFPHPCDLPYQLRNQSDDNFYTIGFFGFLLPHKGLRKLISAIGILRQNEINVKLIAYSAIIDERSQNELSSAEMMIADLRLNDFVTINTEFLDIKNLRDGLNKCDFIVLPYDDVDESASGAVRECMAANVPCLVSEAKIFHEFEGVLVKINSSNSSTLSEGISKFIHDKTLHAMQLERQLNFCKSHSWDSSVNKFWS